MFFINNGQSSTYTFAANEEYKDSGGAYTNLCNDLDVELTDEALNVIQKLMIPALMSPWIFWVNIQLQAIKLRKLPWLTRNYIIEFLQQS